MPGYEKLRRSIEEFDLVQPIVWNEQTGHVVGGHQRLEILKAQGRGELDVVVVSLSPVREKALNVALNNPKVGGEFDPGKLLGVIEELAELPEADATLTGFDKNELRDLVLTPAPLATSPEEISKNGRHVQVILEIDPDAWEAVRPDVDSLLAEHDLKAHIKMP